MKVAVIVQARMESTRLPGKVLQDLSGRPILSHVLERCLDIPSADVVVCACPDRSASAPIEEIAKKCGTEIFRGSEEDVLGRYHGAAHSVDAEIVMRVTSDCPLIDPNICESVLALRDEKNADYASNNLPRTFPHGLDCEVFTFAALDEAARVATEVVDREHVTPWMRRAAHLRRANLESGRPELERMRWTIDYPEDLAFLRAVYAALPQGSAARMDEVLTLLAAHPEIVKINAMRHQRSN